MLYTILILRCEIHSISKDSGREWSAGRTPCVRSPKEAFLLRALLQREIPTEETEDKPDESLYHGSCETSTALLQAQYPVLRRNLIFFLVPT